MNVSQGSSTALYDRIAYEIERNIPSLDAARRQFRLSVKNNAYPERAVSHFFIRAIADAIGAAQVFLEVPTLSGSSVRHDNHLDALVFNNEIAVLAEFKRAWSPSHWRDLGQDVDRVRKRIAVDVSTRFLDSVPRAFHGFYGIDAWRLPIAAAWKSGTKHKEWIVPEVLSNLDRRMQPVWKLDEAMGGKGMDHDGYYLLWAMEPLTVSQ